jgi:hypothetical protein
VGGCCECGSETWDSVECGKFGRVKNEVLHRIKKERNILRTLKRRKANRIGYILHRNCLLKHIIEGTIEEEMEVTGIQGRRCKHIQGDLRNERIMELIGEALDRTVCRTGFGRGCGPLVRQTKERMECVMNLALRVQRH